MKKNVLFVITGSLIIGLFLTGCATNKSAAKALNFDKKPIELASGRQYEILGPVTVQKAWSGIVGFTIAMPAGMDPIDAYIYQSGGVTYLDLFNEAQTLYPGATAVVDIKVDYIGSVYAIFYAKRDYILHGIAIKYKQPAEAPGTPSLDVRLK